MPRKSLPPKIKGLQSYDVVLMHTTEEEIRQHIKDSVEKFEENFVLINAKQNRMLSRVIDENPYAGLSWRRGINRLEFDDWMGKEEEKYFEMMKYILQFKHDFSLCKEVFEWDEPKIEFLIEKYGTLSEKENEFKFFEKARANQSRSEWEIRDAEWIKENKLKQEHKSHKSRSEWEAEFKKIESEMGLAFLNRWFPDGIPNHDSCIFCINEAKAKKEAEEFCKQQELEQAKRDEEWAKQKKQEKNQQEKMTCECCNFSTFSDEVYEIHLDSREHKKTELLKKTYCKDCGIQCRTELDFNIHVQTKKHKYTAGIIEKQTEFHCEKCNYTTQLKQHFDKHCLTKSHNEKV